MVWMYDFVKFRHWEKDQTVEKVVIIETIPTSNK